MAWRGPRLIRSRRPPATPRAPSTPTSRARRSCSWSCSTNVSQVRSSAWTRHWPGCRRWPRSRPSARGRAGMVRRAMSVTAVGSIAFDPVKTPFGSRERMLGGSAVHFALAASFFAEVHVVGPVGDDFGEAELEVLRARGINTDDIEQIPGGQTFFWRGEYGWDLNQRTTLDTQLGVFADFEPKLSDASRGADVLFLANIQPELQRRVREQCPDARFTAMDSMNLWIETARDALVE